MPLETYLVYLAALAAFFVSPPDTSQLLVISNSLRHGIRRSAFTIAGDLTANVVQMTAAAFGLAAAISLSADAFIWIKWLGVAWLAWLGLRLMFSRREGPTTPGAVRGLAFRLFQQGFVTSMANPFAVVFFGAFFPQFIDPARPVGPQLLILGASYLLVDGAILVLWGWFARGVAGRVGRGPFRTMNRICGGLMLAAAALLATKDLSPGR